MTDDIPDPEQVGTFAESMSTVYVADDASLDQLADRIERGELRADRLKIELDGRTLQIAAEDDMVVATIEKQ